MHVCISCYWALSRERLISPFYSTHFSRICWSVYTVLTDHWKWPLRQAKCQGTESHGKLQGPFWEEQVAVDRLQSRTEVQDSSLGSCTYLLDWPRVYAPLRTLASLPRRGRQSLSMDVITEEFKQRRKWKYSVNSKGPREAKGRPRKSAYLLTGFCVQNPQGLPTALRI